jgi:mono/diheme cytochrome c family protein
VAIGALFYAYASYRVDQRLARWYDVKLEQLPISNDSTAIAKGAHLVDIKGCRDCHGNNLGGHVFSDDALVGLLAGPNLTRGDGGLPRNFGTGDWIKAIRHGLNSEGFPLMVMPSLETSKMSEEDLQNMIAYLENLPAFNNRVPKSKLGIMIKTLTFLGKLEIIPAEQIDHQSRMIPQVDTTSPEVFGKYLSAMCSGCHHANMKGGDAMAPGFPPVPDLTSTGAVGKWSQQQFSSALRTGRRPDGTLLDPNMPVQMTRHYSDEELNALYMYLKTL